MFQVDPELYQDVKAKLVESNIERTRLKMELAAVREEAERKAKEDEDSVADAANSSQDYRDFQVLNTSLQVEIQSLKEDLQRQQVANESLMQAHQQQLQQQQQPQQPSASDEMLTQQVFHLQQLVQQQQTQLQQAQQQVAAERQLVQQLEGDLQFKDASLRRAEDELEEERRSGGAASLTSTPISKPTGAMEFKYSTSNLLQYLIYSSGRERTSSEVSQSSSHFELSAAFAGTPSAGETYAAAERLTSENDRLRQDLDKTMRENRHLTSQMESWKQQLTDISRSDEEGGVGEDDEEDDGEGARSPSLRARQARAWRSVGALQLRVEQLTLEVTKVRMEEKVKVGNILPYIVFFSLFLSSWRSATPSS